MEFRRADKKLEDLGGDAYGHGERTAQKLTIAAKNLGGSMPDTIYVLSAYVAGIMKTIAMCVADQKKYNPKATKTQNIEDFDPCLGITADTLLFSALLTNKITPDYNHKNESSDSAMSAITYWEAMEAFEKLTGKQADDFIMPGIAEAGRVASVMGKDVLEAFIERRKNAPPSSSSLN